MPRRYWSFLMPAEDHMFIKRLLAYHHMRLSVWGKIVVAVAFLGAAVASPGTHIAAYLLPSFIIALLITAWLLSLFFRPQVTAKRILPPPPSAGGFCTYTVVVKNTGKRPIRNLAVYESMLPYGLYAALNHPNFHNTIDWLEPEEEKKVTLVMRTPRRGVFELSPLMVGSSFPSGLCRKPVKGARRERFIVYPKFTTQTHLKLLPRRIFQAGGVAESSKVGDSNEFLSTREFRYGDRLRDVHWPSSARAGKLIVKEYIEEYIVRVGIVVDTQWDWRTKLRDFEARVSLAAGMADALEHRDHVIDLFTTDERIPPVTIGRSLGNLDNLLETLSLIEGDEQIDLKRLFVQLQSQLIRFSSLVVILRDWDRERFSFIEKIKRYGVPLRVFVVCKGAPRLPVDESIQLITPKETEELVV